MPTAKLQVLWVRVLSLIKSLSKTRVVVGRNVEKVMAALMSKGDKVTVQDGTVTVDLGLFDIDEPQVNIYRELMRNACATGMKLSQQNIKQMMHRERMK